MPDFSMVFFTRLENVMSAPSVQDSSSFTPAGLNLPIAAPDDVAVLAPASGRTAAGNGLVLPERSPHPPENSQFSSHAPIETLPVELIVQILDFLDVQSLANVSRTSRTMHAVQQAHLPLLRAGFPTLGAQVEDALRRQPADTVQWPEPLPPRLAAVLRQPAHLLNLTPKTDQPLLEKLNALRLRVIEGANYRFVQPDDWIGVWNAVVADLQRMPTGRLRDETIGVLVKNLGTLNTAAASSASLKADAAGIRLQLLKLSLDTPGSAADAESAVASREPAGLTEPQLRLCTVSAAALTPQEAGAMAEFLRGLPQPAQDDGLHKLAHHLKGCLDPSLDVLRREVAEELDARALLPRDPAATRAQVLVCALNAGTTAAEVRQRIDRLEQERLPDQLEGLITLCAFLRRSEGAEMSNLRKKVVEKIDHYFQQNRYEDEVIAAAQNVVRALEVLHPEPGHFSWRAQVPEFLSPQ